MKKDYFTNVAAERKITQVICELNYSVCVKVDISNINFVILIFESVFIFVFKCVWSWYSLQERRYLSVS